ncbi:Signal peptidase complex catalytic subunit SEC11C [Nosema bombycis CQ1]|uniref:Signal peptidase complex catalytic subunit SEC11 n=1 Tax=Nosema bombycis (strain CQ1 / CVCC 102059) TaxID=578461 RepID=R0MAU4_NOSB1|nr:Signal peptidase complex catalytic subunit SEC11C [Nosema bombycis CQ1]|eukprot:EOB11165.1 Signal peptidase complex catalytic subunit SEC11C [Nosema bombycis CQ1]
MDLLFSSKDIAALKRMTFRQILLQGVNAAYSIISPYIIWKFVSLLLNNDSPIVVVLSESMSPGFERGDILWLKPKAYTTGDMTVFQLYKNTIPIVHRAIKQFGTKTLTKGDNNRLDDVGLYRPNQYYLEPNDIKSCVYAYIPYSGMLTIWINTVPGLKPLILGVAGLLVFLNRE